MGTHVSLGPHFEGFVETRVQSGRYNNASEVVREGLRLLEVSEELHRAKLAGLRADIQEGLESGPATPLDMSEVKAAGKRLRRERQAPTNGKA